MRQGTTVVANKLSRSVTPFLVLVVVLLLAASQAKAGDREDAKALVGKWEATAFLERGFELKANGVYDYGFNGEWEVKGGKLITKTFLGTSKLDFTLTPDGNKLTLTFPSGLVQKYTRKK